MNKNFPIIYHWWYEPENKTFHASKLLYSIKETIEIVYILDNIKQIETIQNLIFYLQSISNNSEHVFFNIIENYPIDKACEKIEKLLSLT